MTKPTIWIDADACPVPVKEMIYRAADKRQVKAIFVANQLLRVPPSPFFQSIRVSSGFDEADNYIVEQLVKGDLVITADIPLAADAIKKGGLVITPRGLVYSTGNIGQALSMRNFMDELRGSGVQTGGPAGFNQADKHKFAQEFDRWLAKL
ncbi:YaiI/YqxD family protein [Parashewanella tropica]|uniref:YaiI/YqxD family protein n=1 Tax=Parashewanella tropica TaxID=2547970 RepID=UPI00105953E7|nr:YaiI/YqxD family protein [Parashewanella tropica]